MEYLIPALSTIIILALAIALVFSLVRIVKKSRSNDDDEWWLNL